MYRAYGVYTHCTIPLIRLESVELIFKNLLYIMYGIIHRQNIHRLMSVTHDRRL